MSDLLARVADSLARSNGLESLTRPLLELIERVTGLESAYLTTVDAALSRQQVRFAHNAGELHIPEGIEVDWGDTLCQRAIQQRIAYTDDVPGLWGDSSAARQLGITTYITSAVRDSDGALLGTLCAASRSRRPLAPDAHSILAIFSRLIAQQLERDALLRELQAANLALSSHAATDSLTGLPNRRALRDELTRCLQEAYGERRTVSVGFVDLDGFKAINDQYGHDTGDHFLKAVAARLTSAMRPGDRVGRWGGDEFLVLLDTRGEAKGFEELRARLEAHIRGSYSLGGTVIDYAGASIGVVSSEPGETNVEALIARADAAMYARKLARRGGSTPPL
jgi:diguanylate cyclase